MDDLQTPSASSIIQTPDTPTTVWKSGRFFPGGVENALTTRPFNLVILNGPSLSDKKLIKHLWATSHHVVCADGGANRLYDSFQTDQERLDNLPAAITGDLDSAREEVLSFYQSNGVIIHRAESQYATDFTKALVYIAKLEQEKPNHYTKPTQWSHSDTSPADSYSEVVAIGALGGRVDQSFHSFHQLYIARERQQRITLISDDSVTFLLEKGRNVIESPRELFGKTCGIIPLGEPVHMTLKGFEWDLDNCYSKFGGDMVSTSNHLNSDVVEVHCTSPMVFTMEIRK